MQKRKYSGKGQKKLSLKLGIYSNPRLSARKGCSLFKGSQAMKGVDGTSTNDGQSRRQDESRFESMKKKGV